MNQSGYGRDNRFISSVLSAGQATRTKGSSKESEHWLHSVVQNASDIIMVLGAHGTISYVNQAVEGMLGYRADELVGVNALSLVHPTNAECMKQTFAEALRSSGNQPPAEVRLRHADGSWRRVEVVSNKLLHNSSAGGVVSNIRDVTERKEAQEKSRFQAQLLDVAGEAVIAVDVDQKVIYWNRAAERLYGWSSKEIMGRNLREMVVPKDLRERAKEIARQITETGYWSGEFVVRHKDGTRFSVLANNRSLHDERGNVVGVISVLRDVTERLLTEQALRESEQRFGSAFRDAAIGMALVGTDGRFLQVNRSLRKILGYSEGELLEKTFQEITHPDDVEADVVHLHQLLTGELETYQKEKRYFHKEGYVVQVLLSVSLVHDEKGKPLYFVSQIQDITERKLAETELMRRTEELAHTNAELEQFTYSVSHDLRAPLRSLDGFSQILLEDYASGLDQEGQDYLRRIRAASQRVGETIDDLLELSRLNHSSVREETVDLGVLAKAFADELQKSQPGRRVKFVIEEGLLVQGDQRLLRIALNHLLNNAWKFTQKHPCAKIELGVRQGDGEPTYFLRDDGAGFDMAYADKLFGPFQRLHSSTEFEGRGIGLAAVRRIIHRHGGRVWAEGAVGEGATFYFTLPHTIRMIRNKKA